MGLVQKEEGGEGIVAQGQAAIWAFKLKSLQRKMGFGLDALLQEGMEVLVQVKVDFHERYGLKLIVEDFDPGYTLGKLALKKRETLLRLKKEGLLEKNKGFDLPEAVQKIAILSSENAAGLKDFLEELQNNGFGYRFDCRLFPVAMQGAKVSEEIALQLNKIKPEKFDAIVIIRGGGSKLDLAAFDEYFLCEKIANAPLPVICGIGHEIDETVLDRVAHTSLKTPTAVAGFIVHHNLRFETAVLQLGMGIKRIAAEYINGQKLLLANIWQTAKESVNNKMGNEKMMLGFIKTELPVLLKNNISLEKNKLGHLDKSIQLLSPEMALKRGFSITLKNGKTIDDAGQLAEGDEIETVFKNGRSISTVKKKVVQ